MGTHQALTLHVPSLLSLKWCEDLRALSGRATRTWQACPWSTHEDTLPDLLGICSTGQEPGR
jgi:hypothetical protein